MSSLLVTVPLDGRVSYLWHILGILTLFLASPGYFHIFYHHENIPIYSPVRG